MLRLFTLSVDGSRTGIQPKVAHDGGKAAARASTATALQDLKVIEQPVRVDPLDPVVTHAAAHPLKSHAPWFDGFCKLTLCFAQFYEAPVIAR